MEQLQWTVQHFTSMQLYATTIQIGVRPTHLLGTRSESDDGAVQWAALHFTSKQFYATAIQLALDIAQESVWGQEHSET